jgi:UDP-glucose 4-epimerase
MPYVTQVAVGRREKLSIFGNDYPTKDGTCERDFIHVVDLARAHVLAVANRLNSRGCRAWNIGTGVPISVLQIKETFEKVNGIQIPTEFVDRREGDLSAFYADASRAEQELEWKPQYTLEDMLADSWNWQKQNPNGF